MMNGSDDHMAEDLEEEYEDEEFEELPFVEDEEDDYFIASWTGPNPGNFHADIDEETDPKVPGRAVTEWGKRLEAYAANHFRGSRRRVYAARELMKIEPDAGITALLELMVDADLYNEEDDDPYGTAEHRFNYMAARILIRQGGAAEQAALWLIAENPNGCDLGYLVYHLEADPTTLAYNPQDLRAAEYNEALHHLAAAPRLGRGLRHTAAGALVDRLGKQGYEDMKSLVADEGLSWVAGEASDPSGNPHAFLVAQYVAADSTLPMGLRNESAEALMEVSLSAAARAFAAILRDLELGDPSRHRIMDRLAILQRRHADHGDVLKPTRMRDSEHPRTRFSELVEAMLYVGESADDAWGIHHFGPLLQHWFVEEVEQRRRSIDDCDSAQDLYDAVGGLVNLGHHYHGLRQELLTDLYHSGRVPQWRTVGSLDRPHFAVRAMSQVHREQPCFALRRIATDLRLDPDERVQWEFTVFPVPTGDQSRYDARITFYVKTVHDSTGLEVAMDVDRLLREQPQWMEELDAGFHALGRRVRLVGSSDSSP